MKTLALPASVEERLAGWARIQEARRVAAPGAHRARPAVTISRQYGCDGFLLASRLQALFQKDSGEPWHIFDKELLDQVARDERISLQMLRHLEEPSRYLEAFGFHPRGAVTTDQAMAKIAIHILHFAREGNAIVVGRAGAVVCHRLENCFHFRLEASLDWRVANLARLLDITRKEAIEREKAQTRLRDHFVQGYLGADLHGSWFDGVFNNERHSLDDIAASIFGYVKSAWREEGGQAK
jgi:hypothetical protein